MFALGYPACLLPATVYALENVTMDYFHYKNQILYAEDVPLGDIANRYGTPCYVYSRATIERHWHAFDQAFGNLPHLICYAVKANSNLAVLQVMAKLGSGFDIVSIGELHRVIKAKGEPKKVVFSGVGKSKLEIAQALEIGIRCFNVESEPELRRISQIAVEKGLTAPISIRVNPDVDAKTHPYISTGLRENKFGIDIEKALPLYGLAQQLPNLDILGVDCHIGSQLSSLSPFVDALDRVLALVDTLYAQGIALQHIDIGGGLGIRYRQETPPDPQTYAQAIADKLRGRDLEIHLEPGRAIVGNAGILLTRVEYLKESEIKNFAIVDCAMNDLLRPSLYDAWQEIIEVDQSAGRSEKNYDVVGPVCETGDFLGKNRSLGIAEMDLLAIRSSGAYGFTMSSNYNSRPRAAEIMVDGDQCYLVRERESFDDLIRGEQLLD